MAHMDDEAPSADLAEQAAKPADKATDRPEGRPEDRPKTVTADEDLPKVQSEQAL